MLSDQHSNNLLYDEFFLNQTFNSQEMLEYSRKEIEWLHKKVNLSKNSKVLDLACGSGRHLKALVDFGYSPYGIDIAPSCVELAQKNCPTVSEQIIQADFLNYDFSRIGKFDLILFAGGSFGYDLSLEVTRNYLIKIRSLLNEKARVVVQYLSKEWAQQEIQFEKTFWKEKAEHFVLDKRALQDDLLRSEKIFIHKNTNLIKRYSDQVRTFDQNDIEAMLVDVLKPNHIEFYSNFSDESRAIKPLPVAIVSL